MKSFLNRHKNFFLDNNTPSSNRNLLKMNPERFQKGEYYLWSWAEIYLRYKKMKASKKVLYSEVLNTSDLNCVDKVSNLFKKINISFKPIKYIKKHNTNEENNFLKTSINSRI